MDYNFEDEKKENAMAIFLTVIAIIVCLIVVFN